MACLALSLQPTNGSDILLQTREWFPPARALVALSAFRQTRLAFAAAHRQNQQNQQTQSSSSAPAAEDISVTAIGDDPLAAASGQVVVGVESKYLIVYRLVNGIYVLGITTPDSSAGAGGAANRANNVFECINIVNQAVSVIVAACRGVDVTPEKLHRKYPEIYMALDIVLRGVGAVRLAAILASIHGESIAKMVHSGISDESRARGAETWVGGPEAMVSDRRAALDAFSASSFELPPETLAAGDEVVATIAPAIQQPEEQKPAEEIAEAAPAEKDPFAASEAVNKPPEEALVGGFKKTKDASAAIKDPTLALAGLEVTTLPPAEATKSTFIGVEGFEGDYGGIEFSKEEASLSEAFEGINAPFGGGLDPSEFVNVKKKGAVNDKDWREVELLASQSTTAAPAGAGTPLENLLVSKTPEMKGPEMHISEEISAEFRESILARVALQGIVYLRTLPPKKSEGKETEFSFKFDTNPGVKRVAMQGSRVSSLGNGLFHIRTAASDEPIPILKYSLQPRLTPIPLRVRLVQRHIGTLLAAMIQYVSNPDLPQPLTNVTFILKLPVDPTLLTVSPKGVLNREDREIRWHIDEIPLKGTPEKLRARMPVDQDASKGEEVEVVAMVVFSGEGASTLSGVSLRPAAEGVSDFYLVNHRYASKNYICN